MSELSPETIITAAAAATAVLCVLKRLCAFDLEVRAHRERERARLHAQVSRRHDTPHVLIVDATTVEAFVDDEPDRGSAQQNEIHFRRTTRRDGEESGVVEFRPTTRSRVPRWVDEVREIVLFGPSKRDTRAPHTQVPAWALALLDPTEADRCAREWAAHLHERIADDELREARDDRRRFVRYAVILAITRRARRVVSSKSR